MIWPSAYLLTWPRNAYYVLCRGEQQIARVPYSRYGSLGEAEVALHASHGPGRVWYTSAPIWCWLA